MKKPSHDLVVIGASAGGIEALCTVVKDLPESFNAAVLVVLHVGSVSVLADVLKRCGPLKTTTGRNGDLIERGHLYVAPPDHHMIVRDSHLELNRGARENRARPAIDPLFRSAAREFRSRVIGVVLTGALDDGAAGLFAIKSRGGIVMVQDPADAQYPSMPLTALRNMEVDHCLPVPKIGAKLTKLVGRSNGKVTKIVPPTGRGRRTERRGHQVPFSCPDCSGPMFAVKEGKMLNFHCDVGHRYSPESLTEAHSYALERAIWIAIRSLRERSAVQRALAASSSSGDKELAARFEAAAELADRDASLLQEILERL
jgi:two-component system chemotaxis response regulator CheB